MSKIRDQTPPNQQQLIEIQNPRLQTGADSSESLSGTNEFKPQIFAEYVCYFLLAQWFGPLTYMFFLRFTKNGYILARNLQIYGGWEEIIRTLLWLGKIYCFIITFFLNNKNYQSMDQFWLVIYTDISIAVLYGAYYSSFTEAEVQRFKKEIHEPGNGIFSKIQDLIEKERVQAFKKKAIINRFPEIDINNFYFIYPNKFRAIIPSELKPQSFGKKMNQLNAIHIQEGLLIRAKAFAIYLTDKSNYSGLKYKILTLRTITRVIVGIKVLLPLAVNIFGSLSRSDQRINYAEVILYVVEQAFYCYFISRIAVVYDILFLGLVLYYQRLKMLRLLRQSIDIRPQNSQENLFKISPTVPHNIENWLNLRKLFTAMNQQAFVVIDTNMSFALFYTMIFVAVYGLYAVSLLTDLLAPLAKFLNENPMFQATILMTLIIIIIVLVADLILGIMINLQFNSERREWTLQSEIIRSMRISHNIYREWRDGSRGQESPPAETDEYLEKVDIIKCLLGESFRDQFELYVKRLRGSIFLLLDGLTYEEIFHPHTLLGIVTTPRLAVSVFTIISAFGISTINDIIVRTTPVKS